jgi:hypothetical protein
MAEAPAHHALVMQFVAAVLQRILHCPTVEAHQQALLRFLDALTPLAHAGRPADAAGPAVYAL